MNHFLKSIIVLATLLMASGACAYSIQTDPGDSTVVIAINGLEIDGTVYNVEFVSGSYDDVSLTSPGIDQFTGNYLGAISAADTIVSVLNSENYDFVGPPSQIDKHRFFVLWDVSDPDIWDSIEQVWEGSSWHQTGASAWFKTSDKGFASFTAVVPVPAAVWLFGSALGLLGWIRRTAT